MNSIVAFARGVAFLTIALTGNIGNHLYVVRIYMDKGYRGWFGLRGLCGIWGDLLY